MIWLSPMASETWAGLGTAIAAAVVSGGVTGLVAVGLFYLQRNADRRTLRIERTYDALDHLLGPLRDLLKSIDAGVRSNDLSYMVELEAWTALAWSTRLRLGDKAVRYQVDDVGLVSGEFRQRISETLDAAINVLDQWSGTGAIKQGVWTNDLLFKPITDLDRNFTYSSEDEPDPGTTPPLSP